MKKAAKKAGKKVARRSTKANARRASAPKKSAPRADLGAPIEGFFTRQPEPLRPILEALRKLVDKAAPDAESSLKWGMPFYTLDGETMCARGWLRAAAKAARSRAAAK